MREIFCPFLIIWESSKASTRDLFEERISLSSFLETTVHHQPFHCELTNHKIKRWHLTPCGQFTATTNRKEVENASIEQGHRVLWTPMDSRTDWRRQELQKGKICMLLVTLGHLLSHLPCAGAYRHGERAVKLQCADWRQTLNSVNKQKMTMSPYNIWESLIYPKEGTFAAL